ncbi:MAG: hypothetical protein P4L36_21800 [Holophaga sp.]|nr:hypothetical protein [Holophaga sp.]
MKLAVQDAVVVLGSAAQAGQSVQIFRNTDQAIIGIDGHSSFRDELVEIRWEGSHRQQLEGVAHVEIRDNAGSVVESLAVSGSREPLERDGMTVFFLTDPE